MGVLIGPDISVNRNKDHHVNNFIYYGYIALLVKSSTMFNVHLISVDIRESGFWESRLPQVEKKEKI